MSDDRKLWPDDGEPFTPLDPMPEPAPPLSRDEWLSLAAFLVVVLCGVWAALVLFS